MYGYNWDGNTGRSRTIAGKLRDNIYRAILEHDEEALRKALRLYWKHWAIGHGPEALVEAERGYRFACSVHGIEP